MKKLLSLAYCIVTCITIEAQNVGIGTTTPTQKLEVNGKIRIGDDAGTPTEGTVRWNTTTKDFEGYNGTDWVSLTKSNQWGIQTYHDNYRIPTSSFGTNAKQGSSVCISDNYAIVGAPADNSNKGAAFIYVRSGTNWALQTMLTASDGVAGDGFGYSVSISGLYAVVGAINDEVGSNTYQGSVYVFRLQGGILWTQQAKLTALDGMHNDGLGSSVAISGDYIIAGAVRDDIGGQTSSGSAYVFFRSGTTWTEQAKLIAADGVTDDFFGCSVSLSGDYAIIGAYGDDIGANGVQGSAYIFLRSGTTWTQQAKLMAADGASGDFLGFSVSISGNYAIVGAYGATVFNNNDQGAAYIFLRSGTTWTQQAKLTDPDGGNLSRLGHAVSIYGDYAIAGSPWQRGPGGDKQGSAMLYVRNGTNWLPQAKFTASDGAEGDEFGHAVSIGENHFLIGAPLKTFSIFNDHGAAYIFRKN